MNPADSFQDPFAVSGSGWIGVPHAAGGLGRMDEPWWPSHNGPFVNGTASNISWGASTTAQPGVIQLTESNSLGTAPTIINFEPTVTLTTTGGGMSLGAAPTTINFEPTVTLTTTGGNSFIGLAGDGRPAAESLAVRRFYHWNKAATAGAAAIRDTGWPGTPLENTPSARAAQDALADALGADQPTKTMTIRVVIEAKAAPSRHGHRWRLVRGTVLSPRSLTRVAVALAGQKRSMVGDEWRGHLLGEPDRGLTQREQIRAARGFVLAAVRYRLQDAAEQAWRPVDAVLKSRGLSNLFVLIPTLMAAMFVLHDEGSLGVVTSAESIITIGGTLYGLVRVGRWYRDVKPSDPKAKRAKEKP